MMGMRTEVSWSPAVSSDGKPQPDVRLSAFNSGDDSVLRIHLSTPDSVWGRAGLHTGDQLVSLNDRAVASSADFRSRLGQLHLGDAARVEIIRNGVASQVSVAIAGYDRPTVRILEIANATSEQLRLRAQWLTAAP
jgi:S1-C subfamily serine protease